MPVRHPYPQTAGRLRIDFVWEKEFKLNTPDIHPPEHAGYRHKGEESGDNQKEQIVTGIHCGKAEEKGSPDIDSPRLCQP